MKIASGVGVAAVLLMTGCDAINPVLVYQEAARHLQFSLDKVEPSMQLAFPLQDSRIRLRLMLGVDNPTQVHFNARHLTGKVSLEQDGITHSVGNVSLPQGMDIAAGRRGELAVDLSFGYRELEKAWGPISGAARGGRGVWRLDGEMRLDTLGIPITLPIRASKAAGQ